MIPPVRSLPAALAALAALALFTGCFDGGGTETGNAGAVSGNVHDGGGTETGNTEVFLISVKYAADSSDSSRMRSTRTNALGRFQFKDVDPGRYAVSVPGSGETPQSAIQSRLTVTGNETRRLDLTVRASVHLLGRIIPDSGASAVRVFLPGRRGSVAVAADSTYRIADAPLGAYELVFLTRGMAHYLAIRVDSSASGTVHLRDLALKSAADADHVPYAFYDMGASASFSSLPVRYAANASPSWYAGKTFDQVEYFLLSETGPPQAWNSDFFTAWKYSRTLSGDALAGGPDLTAALPGFPLPVRLASADFDFSQAKADGSDLVVSDGAGRLLAHQIERWDPAAGKAEIWTRMESLAAGKADRRAVLHWGRNQSMPPSGSVFRREDGFIGAWHLNERGSDSAVADASSRFQGRLRGPLPAGGLGPLRGEAVIGGGYRFGATSNYVNVSHDPALDVSRTFTVAIWARVNLPQDTVIKQVLATKWAPGKREWHFHIQSNRSLELELGDSLGFIQGAWRTVAPLTGRDKWHHYAATFDNGAVKLYVDGVEMAGMLSPELPVGRPGSIPRMVSRFQSALNLGSNTTDFTLNLDGDLDEFWYSPDAKSAAWIRMAYETQKPKP